MKRKELETEIQTIESKIVDYKQLLKDMRQELSVIIEQEKEREHYISSREIIDLITKNTGKRINMSTIKRWADEGYLGEVIEEKDKFWALRYKQGKKRFLYPVIEVYHFLYEKGYLLPKYEVLDRVSVAKPDSKPLIGVVIDSELKEAKFYYTIQIEGLFDQLTMVSEDHLTKKEQERPMHESEN